MRVFMKIAMGLVGAGLLLPVIACSSGEDETPFPATTPFPPELEQRIHEIRDRVSRIRGLPPYAVVVEGIISPEAMQQYSREQVQSLSDEEKSDLEAADMVLTTLGLIGPEVDLAQVYSDEFSGIYAGFYVIDEDRLVLVGSGDVQLTMENELTLAHEYVHSFQDGRWAIDEVRKRYYEGDLEEDGFSQYSTTIDCLIEGDAELAQELYAVEVFGSDWQSKLDAESSAAAVETAKNLPEFLLRDALFNYSECPLFVRALYDEGGWDAVNAAYDSPPATTEQVIHLDKYRDRELANSGAPKDLTEQLKEWRLMDSSQFGQYDVYNYALTLMKDPYAAIAAAVGWGSGWSTIYRDEADPSRVIVQLSFGWDTQDDLLEFLIVYDGILSALGASVEVLDEEGNARWTSAGQFGVITVDTDLARAEIRIASHEDALTLATSDLDAFN